MKLFFWKSNFVIDSFAKKLADDFFSITRPETVDAYFTELAITDSGAHDTPLKGGNHQKPTAAKHTKTGSGAKSGAATKTAQQIERNMHDTALKLAQFKAQEKLGVYGKARLHMSFAERLDELGFSKDTVQQLNRMLLLRSP